MPPLFHDAGNSDLLKHMRKRKIAHLSQSRNHKDGTAPASKPSQATKPVSAQGPRSGKAAVAQSGQQGGRGKEWKRVGSTQADARPECLISFHLSTLQQIPGECRVPAGFGCGRGRRAWEADGPIALEQNPAHSFTHSLASHSESPEVLPACQCDSMQAQLPGKNASPPLLSLT